MQSKKEYRDGVCMDSFCPLMVEWLAFLNPETKGKICHFNHVF